MKGKDEIKELFSDKLGNFEAQVRPDLWTNIASQIGGTTATVATSGLSLLSKTFIGVGIGAAVVTTVLLVAPFSNTPLKDKKAINTTGTNSNTPQEEVLINNNSSQEEAQKPLSKPEKTINKQVETNSSTPLINNEIDQTQNFRTDISLIDVKKDQPIVKQTDKEERKEQVVPPAVEKNNKTEFKFGEIKQDIEKIKEIETKEIEKQAYSLAELPNVFTPNGDGENDLFFITSKGLQDFTIVVLNDKQKVVYESNNPEFKWDGTDKFGNKVQSGTYAYYIIAQDSNGNKVNKFMSLQIVF